MYLLLFTYR
uniref:Uncharacterized protein n=1 Tax=Anguilla anguilla TaxID=7936 RepID=A0A0E9SEB0_ANGAN